MNKDIFLLPIALSDKDPFLPNRASSKSFDQSFPPYPNQNPIFQDVIPSSSPRLLHHLNGRPPWLPLYPCSNGFTIPLPRGTTKQHSIQPTHQILCRQILGIHDCWIRCTIRHCSLANIQEPIEGFVNGCCIGRTVVNRLAFQY
ncbi:hypothetical protein EYC84_005792 [Monilinia fructicola]|uniref:Uncharacterized protein n=1 Tax=Monilinia fructicola TaxID=38448 RepID=A0A5M9K1K2_MONFR|nr:hypothetical protein EYC84_005792 [Monilinia fructicola]